MFDNDKNESYVEEFGVTTKLRDGNEFKPWHKPRKQWVREKQWWLTFSRMINKNSVLFTNESTVKYFGLPGEDLLDVDYISNMMENTPVFSGKKLLVHGIIKSPVEKSRADSRLTVLLDRKSIDDASKVENFEFESLANTSAVLWDRVRGIAPYHMINLDFCEKVFQDRTITAVYNLLDYQFSALAEKPWLFCLTTRVDVNDNNLDVLKRLYDCLQKIEKDQLSIFKLEEYFSPVFNAIKNKLKIEAAIQNPPLFVDIYIVGFVIWLILNANEKGVTYKLKSSAKYGVANKSDIPDMYSFVFEFRKKIVIQPDKQGIAIPLEKKVESSQCTDPRENAIKKLSSTVNIDEILRSSTTILDQYIKETKEALSACGWNVEEYERRLCSEYFKK